MPRFFRPDGVARYTHNAVRLPQEVEPLGGFLSEADDALGSDNDQLIQIVFVNSKDTSLHVGVQGGASSIHSGI